MQKRIIALFIVSVIVLSCRSKTSEYVEYSELSKEKQEFLNDLKKRTFYYFWNEVDSATYQIPDRFPARTFTSIAATGFGLTSYLSGINSGYITREEGAQRVLKTLQWLWSAKQGSDSTDVTGYKGFFYHFLTYERGTRYSDVELSTIDTGLLIAGILACQSFFDGNSEQEKEINALSDSLYLRVEWDWAMNGNEYMSMGWTPEKGFIASKWKGYNEAMILIVMALGSPTHPIQDSAWESWCKSYMWDNFYGYPHINFSPLFGHQYSHMFIDFRNIVDEYMGEKGIDYFENSRRATLSNRAYCIDNPMKFKGYSENIWGLTACDGPTNAKQFYNGDSIMFYTYMARGASSLEKVDDGTIAPTAAGGSIPFAPRECIDALFFMNKLYGKNIYKEYGFIDAFNLTYQLENGENWFETMYLGIDQGPIIIQIENYQNNLIWDLMKKNKYIVTGLKKAGFTGGWIDKV